jgi:hypothetical protein
MTYFSKLRDATQRQRPGSGLWRGPGNLFLQAHRFDLARNQVIHAPWGRMTWKLGVHSNSC